MMSCTFDFSYYSTGAYDNYAHDCLIQGDELVQNLLKNLKIEREDSVLDIGCGLGGLVASLRKAGFESWGTEISAYCLKESRVSDFIVNASATHLPFKNSSFDIIVSDGVLFYLTLLDLHLALQEIRRICRKGFYIDTISEDSPNADQKINPDSMRQNDRLLSKAEWSRLLELNGFNTKRPLLQSLDNPDFHGYFSIK